MADIYRAAKRQGKYPPLSLKYYKCTNVLMTFNYPWQCLCLKANGADQTTERNRSIC